MAKRKSRLQRVESKKATRSAFLYILLSIVAVFLLFRYGISAVSYVSTFVIDNLGEQSQIAGSGSRVPPAPPRLDDLPRYTNENKITVRGSTVAGFDVVVVVNGEKNEVIANAKGDFSVSVPISENEINTIYAITIAPSGVQSKDSDRFSVQYDNEEPEIEIIAPGDEIFGESNRQTQIEGQTEPNASVRINDRVVIVRSDGKFDYSTRLENGENVFKIVVTDEAGNTTEIEKKINFIS